jgi:hypothetical protein
MPVHCAAPIDQFVSYCAKMRQIYGQSVPLMSRAQWDAACNEPSKARILNDCEFDTNQFSMENGDGEIY